MFGMVEASPAELVRRLENLLRAGTVAAVDITTARCRVRTGGLLSDWLPWFAQRAGDVRAWCPPSVGEQCLLMSPGGDLAAALVLVGLYSDARPAPETSAGIHATHYPDGAVITYDHAAHALTVTLPAGGTAEITAPGSVTVRSDSVTIEAPQTTCTGQLLVQGLLTYQGGMAGSGGSGGAAAVIEGTVQATGDVVASGISLTSHTHGGVRAGGESSGAPQ